MVKELRINVQHFTVEVSVGDLELAAWTHFLKVTQEYHQKSMINQ